MIPFWHAHATALTIGAVSANGALTMNAIRDRSWGWAIFHIGLAMMCAAWFA